MYVSFSGVARIFCGGVLFTSKRNVLILNRIHVNPERSCGGTNGEPPSEASQLRKGGPGVVPRKILKTYIANGAIFVIPEHYL